MRKTFFILVCLLGLMTSSCQNMHVDFLETQVQKFVTPENVALAVTASYLHAHPEADITMLQLADELRNLSEGGMLDLETAYLKIEAAMERHDLKYTKEVLFLLRGLFDQYVYIFDTTQVDMVTYRDTLVQLADGIEEALAVTDARTLLKEKTNK